MNGRRRFLAIAGGALASPSLAQLPPNIEALRRAALDEAIKRATGGASVRTGRVSLDLPPLIDNGNSVPLSVRVDSPMTAADHVKSIHVFTEKNPQPTVFEAHLGPRAGRAEVSTRVRIADSGRVVAIAAMSDGSFWSGTMSVVVILSACLEDGLI